MTIWTSSVANELPLNHPRIAWLAALTVDVALDPILVTTGEDLVESFTAIPRLSSLHTDARGLLDATAHPLPDQQRTAWFESCHLAGPF